MRDRGVARDALYDRLAAEADAWPLASRTAFDLRTIELGRRGAGTLDAQTLQLATGLETYLRTRAGGMSIAVLDRLRDRSWFGQRTPGGDLAGGPLLLAQPLASYLVALSARYLVRHGPCVRLERQVHTNGEETLRWRWLSLALPADLLVAGLYAAAGPVPPTDVVTLVSPLLAQGLCREVANTHLHLGAAASFTTLWSSLMSSLVTEGLAPAHLAREAALPFGTPVAFVSMLTAAAVSRLVLATYLRSARPGGHRHAGRASPFARFWHDDAGLPALAGRLRWPSTRGSALRALTEAARHVVHGRSRLSNAALARLYQSVAAAVAPRPPGRAPHGAAGDPMASLFPPASGVASPELQFLHGAVRHLLRDDDRSFAELFWQYVRVRNLTHRYLAQRPWTAGLDWFSRHYDRIGPLSAGLWECSLTEALRLESADLCLASLEVRRSPPDTWDAVALQVAQVAAQADRYDPPEGAARPEVGIVYHFIKEHRCRCGRLHADPRHVAFSNRYAPWFRRAMRQADALAAALGRDPTLLLLLRGIDVANVELGIPTWVLVPVFRRVDQAALAAAEALARRRPLWKATPLRHTMHAGEDFRRLAEGLRRIHEAVEFGLLQPGDRIGHAVALALDPEEWARRSPRIAQPAEDRLDDLLWELDRSRSGAWATVAARIECARGEALRIGRRLYGDALSDSFATIDDLQEARRQRHDASVLQRLGYPSTPATRPGHGRTHCLVRRHLTDGALFDRGAEPELVDVDRGEIEMLRHAQRWLKDLLAGAEITVEANPSSNLLIGGLGLLESHPLFALRRPPDGPEGAASVLVSVNDDDPVTFATRLCDEFGYLHAALLSRGASSQQALAFIDALRETGWRSRFTLPASAARPALAGVAPLRQRRILGRFLTTPGGGDKSQRGVASTDGRPLRRSL